MRCAYSYVGARTFTRCPAGIQLVFYLATLLVIGTLMRLVGAPARAPGPNDAPAARQTQLQPGE